jgi:glycosyltransferase involved in cell wall biosynthesis
MKDPLVTVIIPVYNTEKYLHRCVNSVLSQTLNDFELILIDDGSSDGCPVLCDEFANLDKRVKTIHQDNRGVSSARNAALDIARGSFVSFVDSDDFVGSDYLRHFVNAMRDDVDLVIAGCSDDCGNGPVAYFPSSPGHFTLDELRANFDAFKVSESPCTKLYRRALIGNLRFEIDVRMNEDCLFNICYYEKCRNFVTIQEADYMCNRANLTSATHSYKPEYFACRIKRYVKEKMFVYSAVIANGDGIDEEFCLEALAHARWVSLLRLPLKQKRNLYELTLDNEYIVPVLKLKYTGRGKERVPQCLLRHRKFAFLASYYKIRRFFSFIVHKKA